MELDNLDIAYFIDYLDKKIHLLDNNFNSFNNILNCITPEFQRRFVLKEHLLIDVLDFEWILYCGNGLVFAYKNYNTTLINKKERTLHNPFLSVIIS